tara:strand:+ start:41441 stop:41881 length:441 start_codon:yes stop_codon:yes gene_type:complete
MGYIRIKKINNSKYAYLVETKNTQSGPRQKVKKYLGRVFDVEKNSLAKKINLGGNKYDFIRSLILREVNFKKLDKIEYKNFGFTKKGKEVTLKINDGFLSSYTLGRLIRFQKSKDLDKDALLLANYFVQAGLTISEKEFVAYYQLL